MKRQNTHSKQAFTWFTIVGTLDETRELIQGFYNDLVAQYKYANETGDTSSPFYGWELRKENVEVYVTFGFDGLSIVLCPRFDRTGDFDALFYDLGGSDYLATVEDVGGSPSCTEFIKVIDYLLSLIKDQIGRVDYSEVEEYCGGGRGYIVLTGDEAPYKPLKAEMKAMGLATPDNLLEQMGYFGPR